MKDELMVAAIEALYREVDKLRPGLPEATRKHIRNKVRELMAALPGFCQLPTGEPFVITGPGHIVLGRHETDDERRRRKQREDACERVLNLLAQDESRSLDALDARAAEMEAQLRRDNQIKAAHERRSPHDYYGIKEYD